MKTRTGLTICVVLLTISLMAPTAFSHEGHGDRAAQLKAKARELLTEDQIQQLKTLRVNRAKETIQLRAEFKIKRLELNQLWRADELDENAIVAKSDEVLAITTKMRQGAIRHRLAISKLVPKEYREAMKKARRFENVHKKRGRGFFGKRYHRGGGIERMKRARALRAHEMRSVDDEYLQFHLN